MQRGVVLAIRSLLAFLWFVAEEKSRSYISWTLPLLHTLHIYFFISLSSQSASSRSGQKPTTHFTRQLLTDKSSWRVVRSMHECVIPTLGNGLISPFWLLAFGVHARHVHVNQIQARNEVSGWEQWLRTQYESHQVDDVSWHTYE
ncbi:GPI-GlcNAc transferase complex, PIG-H component [Musa troglodytarum]|uniref:GPI-GlcNAc transferase complex, PIG-H component n=1 Tax=Musa troglodytarum TaxID=320322 RepID=A0A9E7HUB4_9LILI|nr:GPI-GlcNAc transferase complex, PIG-H component [Musa troglodytarum]